jgi:hypothetical protein
MNAPATVRVEELGSDRAGYRDVTDERRRVVHVRGSSPTRAYVVLAVAAITALGTAGWLAVESASQGTWVVLVGLLAAAVLVQLGLPTLWRAVQRARFELGRELVVRTGPFGAHTRAPGWSARAPVVVERSASWGKPLVRFASWDLYVERDDGRRVQLATLHDEASVRFVTQQLRETYRDAEQAAARHPFAVKFGPIPEGVTCEGDPDDLRDRWSLELRCPRGSLFTEILALLGLVLIAGPVTIAALVGLLGFLGRPSAGALVGTLFATGMAAALVQAAFSQLRLCVLRWRGRVVIELGPEGLALRTSPWRIRPLAPPEVRGPGAVSLRVTPVERQRGLARGEARVELVHAQRAHRVLAPLTFDDATYAAKVVAAYEVARIPR